MAFVSSELSVLGSMSQFASAVKVLHQSNQARKTNQKSQNTSHHELTLCAQSQKVVNGRHQKDDQRNP